VKGLADAAVSAKTGLATAGGTVASGLAQLVGIIPNEIGKLATLIGIALSIVMISYWRAQKRKTQLESELIVEQIKKLKSENEKA